MANLKLQKLDVYNFVFQMFLKTNEISYMYESQIKDLIEYTKHYYSCDASIEEITEIFKSTLKNLK